MKKIILFIHFTSLSIASNAQGLHLGYLFKSAVVSDTHFYRSDTDKYLYAGGHFLLKLKYNSDSLLSSYILYSRKNSRRHNYKLNTYFQLEYDSALRLVLYNQSKPFAQPYSYFYGDSSNLFSDVASADFGSLNFGYANGLVKDVTLNNYKISFQYDANNNIIGVFDPCRIGGIVRPLLYNTNDYLSMSKDFAITRNWTLKRIDKYTYRTGQSGTALTFTSGDKSQTIYTNSSIRANIKQYPSCPNCNTDWEYFPIKVSFGLNFDALGILKINNNYIATISGDVRAFINNQCYTKILFANYVAIYGSWNIWGGFHPPSLNTNSGTPILLTNQQRIYLLQVSQYDFGEKFNLVKASAHKKYYEANVGVQQGYSEIHSIVLNKSLPYNMYALYGELMFEMVSSNKLKTDFSAQYVLQNNDYRGDIAFYNDRYVIPAIELKFPENERYCAKVACVKQVTTSNVQPYLLAQFGCNYIPFFSRLSTRKAVVLYKKHYIGKRRYNRIIRRKERREARKNKRSAMQ